MKLKIISLDFSENYLMNKIIDDILNIFKVFEDYNIYYEKIPEECFVKERNQYLASCILNNLYKKYYEENSLVLALTSKDIFDYPYNFLFGLAYYEEKICLVSVYRLKFNLNSNMENLFYERVIKEVLHEIGHCFGLDHCSNWNCVMHFSNSVKDVDSKGIFYCESCREKIREYLKI